MTSLDHFHSQQVLKYTLLERTKAFKEGEVLLQLCFEFYKTEMLSPVISQFSSQNGILLPSV